MEKAEALNEHVLTTPLSFTFASQEERPVTLCVSPSVCLW